ncbi:hypothetical protein CEXT_589371 [Caerostris extrusa]|uniref:Uncharacterized protein n=1 Tax=Caerostris extrusa TaxID=172846 RepID=A0AAV4QGI2_CAEEX|nr:hypothetical protein CEXT_589371 [Caerostris extrusa]
MEREIHKSVSRIRRIRLIECHSSPHPVKFQCCSNRSWLVRQNLLMTLERCQNLSLVFYYRHSQVTSQWESGNNLLGYHGVSRKMLSFARLRITRFIQ